MTYTTIFSAYERRLRRTFRAHNWRRQKAGLPERSYEDYCVWVADKNLKREQSRKVHRRSEEGTMSARQAGVDDHDVSRHVLERIVRQESGLTSRGSFTSVGEGCWRRVMHKGA